MPDMIFLLSSGRSGIGVLDEMALEDGAPTAVVALALARSGVAEFFPARMRQLDPGAAILCREADFDQLLLPGRQLDDPGKSQAMGRVISQHGSPQGFA